MACSSTCESNGVSFGPTNGLDRVKDITSRWFRFVNGKNWRFLFMFLRHCRVRRMDRRFLFSEGLDVVWSLAAVACTPRQGVNICLEAMHELFHELVLCEGRVLQRVDGRERP